MSLCVAKQRINRKDEKKDMMQNYKNSPASNETEWGKGPFREEFEKLRAALAQCEAKLHALLQASPDLVFVLDRDQRFVSYHSTLVPLLYPPSTFLGKRHGEVMGPELDALFQPAFEKVRQGEIVEYSYPLMKKEGRRWFSVRLSPWFVDEEFQGVIAVVRDITNERAMQEQIALQATTDAVTGLPNRVLFRDRLTQAIYRRARHPQTLAAVFYVDLDRFKILNEAIGHDEGDVILREVGARLSALLRPEDTVARLGSDEFAVLAEGFDSLADITRMADRLNAALNQPYGSNLLHLTASMGVVVIQDPITSSAQVLRDAEAALATAKRSTRGKYSFFVPTMHEEALRTLALENDLRRALEVGQLAVYYQPVVENRTRAVVGLEALVRWPHPVRGMISPSEFIPVAEEAGLVCELDLWVFERVCRQVREWESSTTTLAQRPWWVSVNFSVEHFANGEFLKALRDILARTGVQAHRLRIELTESVFLRYAEKAKEVLTELNRMGLSTCLDDFGKGYSAMGYLLHLPIHVLKIDLSFLRNVPGDTRAENVVRVMTQLGQGLQLCVIAEGVEHESQAEFLRTIGCELAQGYYYGRPMPPEEAGKILVQGMLE